MALMLPLLAFVFASLLVAAIGIRFAGSRGNVIDRRLAEVIGRAEPADETPQVRRPEGSRFASSDPRCRSRRRTWARCGCGSIQAGYRGGEALPLFYGIRMSIAIGAFVLMATPLLLRPNVTFGLGGSLLGYLLPGIVLAKLAKKRQHKIQLGLADALDLMVVSVEAGLGLDQAILARGRRAVLCPSRPVERAAAGEHRAARGQGPHRGASQPGRPDRPRGHRRHWRRC